MNTLTTPMMSDEDLALELGGKLVRKDGSVFNAAGRSGVSRLPKVAASPTPVEPTPAPVVDTSPILDKIVELLSRENPAPVVNVPEAQPAQVVVQAPARVSWRFDFERNPDKTIKAIVASPFKE